MEEGQVTIEGETFRLPEPFLVIATQNPVEYEGTYALPEAQLDRFQFKVLDRKSTRLNSSHSQISYAVFCLKKKKETHIPNCTHTTKSYGSSARPHASELFSRIEPSPRHHSKNLSTRSA